MPPALESWDDVEMHTEEHTKHIQDTLSAFAFNKAVNEKAKSLRLVRVKDAMLPRRPTTLAEDLMRVKTCLEIAMGIDPSPRTVIRDDGLVQRTERREDINAATAHTRAATLAEDWPIVDTNTTVLEEQHTPEVEAQEDVIQSIEADIETEESVEDGVSGRLLSKSRDTTPDIVRSKLEALGMFSRDGTSHRSHETPIPAIDNEQTDHMSLDGNYTEDELDEIVRRKLEAAGVIASQDEVASRESYGDESDDIPAEDIQDDFLQSKLEALGIIPRRPAPIPSSSSASSRKPSSITIAEDQVGTADVYDEFLQAKLEAMGIIEAVRTPMPAPTSPPANLPVSDESQLDLTSTPSIVIEAAEPTSQGDNDPPFSRPASPAAVTTWAAKQNADDNALLEVPSRQSSVEMGTDETPSLTRESSYSTLEDGPAEARKESIVEIRAAQLIHPLSRYDNYERPLPISKERTVVKEFCELLDNEHNAEHAEHSFVEFDMDDFMIYLPGSGSHHPYEMSGLQNIFQLGHQEYLIDGILSFDGEDGRYVEGIPFNTLSIGSYGKDHQEITGVWIQTRINSKTDVYYRLRKPHRHYERFHAGFMWLANLSKNFVDYALDTIEAEKEVSIHNFRRDFYDWLVAEHGEEEPFKKWYAEYGNPDFRTAIASNVDWLAKEAIGTYRLENLDVWNEVKYLTKLPFHDPKEYKTIVTPFVYECFKEMPFGRFLKKVDPSAETDFRRKSIGAALHLSTDADVVEVDAEDGDDYEKTTARLAKRSLEDFKNRPLDMDSISVGDVLAVVKDSSDVSKWKSQKTKWNDIDECWFAYVQSIEITKRGERGFRILWMYKPADTSCALMKYPYQDELFLSAHCECDRKKWVTEDQIICRVSVAWGGSHGCKEDFFVRQRFNQHDISFTTLKESDKKCECMTFLTTPAEVVQRDFQIGSTVLVKLKRSSRHQRLEPCEIVSFNEDESLTVRRLLRRSEAQPGSHAKANELVYTDQMLTIPPEQVHHECQVRFYSSEQVGRKEIPQPYDLNGSCDFFYICTRLVEDFLTGDGQRFEDLNPLERPASLIQGFDPKAPVPKNPMRGLDLFCGGGNMGRGLEDGGAVRFTHACDYQDTAIASYYANTEDVEHTRFFAGSVNDLLKHAMEGNPSNISGVPLPGDIEFISAGSPCQGFSHMNPLKEKDSALRNQSLVADVAAMVEFYRPKYAVLENVVGMAKRGEKREEDCLSQLICCLVGMGYQLQVNLLDAWSFGCPQRRTRLFVVVAAPDLAMPKHPYLSHSHPENLKDKGLGVMANGESFGERQWDDTAFKWVSAEAATADLPDIGDGQTYHCTPFPDHKTSFNMKDLLRKQLAAVPRYPPGMNAAKAWPKMSQHERDLYATKSTKTGLMEERPPSKLVNSYGRVRAKDLFPTITTACAPTERFNGKVAHWSQERVITILEAKRAQGFLDTDVLVGSRKEQYKIVGNSVARPVAIAQGMALRKAWLQNEDENPSLDAALVPITVRDDVAHLDLESATSSKGSELAYRRALQGLGTNSEVDEDSSVSSAPPRRRDSEFAVEVPARNSIVQFGSSPIRPRAEQEPVHQIAEYRRPVSALPLTPACPGAQQAAVAADDMTTPATMEPEEQEDVTMPDASPVENRWQDFDELPTVSRGMSEARKAAKKRRRLMEASRDVSASPAPAPVPAAGMSRADAKIVKASKDFKHLGRRRSQGPSRAVTPPSIFHPSCVAPPSSAAQPSSRAVTPHVHVEEEDEPPRTAKRRKLPSKPILPGSAERPITLDDSDDEPTPSPPAVPQNTPASNNSNNSQASAPLPVSVVRHVTPTPAPGSQRSSGWTAVNNSSSPDTPALASSQKAVAQQRLAGRSRSRSNTGPSTVARDVRAVAYPVAISVGSRSRSRSRPSTSTSISQSQLHPQPQPQPQSRPKKAKKLKEPKPFVIDLTADSDSDTAYHTANGTDTGSSGGGGASAGRQGKRKEIRPYEPVDNSAWMGMMFTKSRLGGLGGAVDDAALLGMSGLSGGSGERGFEDVERVRRAESGVGGDEDGDGEVGGQMDMAQEPEREVVYAY